MTGKPLPDRDHVVRYVKPTLIDGGTVDGGAFVLHPTHAGLSVNWLDYFGGTNQLRQMDEVRRLFRLGLARNGRFARLNVGRTKQHVSEGAMEAGLTLNPGISQAPSPATDDFEADPSHADITGLPPPESDHAMLVGDLIANCVQYPLYPARTD